MSVNRPQKLFVVKSMGVWRIPGITPHEQRLKKADLLRPEQTRRVGQALPTGDGINFKWHGPPAVRRAENCHVLAIMGNLPRIKRCIR